MPFFIVKNSRPWCTAAHTRSGVPKPSPPNVLGWVMKRKSEKSATFQQHYKTD